MFFLDCKASVAMFFELSFWGIYNLGVIGFISSEMER